MITPEDIRAKASGKFLTLCRNWVTGEDMYPMSIRANLNPTGVSESILKDGWKKLYEGSREQTGKNGYILEFKEVRTRLRGVQSQPGRLIIPSREDHLSLIGKNAAFKSFRIDVEAIRGFLVDENGSSWCAGNTSLILRHPGEWDTIVQVVQYLEENTEASESLREIPVADSKFTEGRKKAVLALAKARSADLGMTLENRWGGTSNWRPTIRFADPGMRFGGLTRITIELAELSTLIENLKPNGLFIIENRTPFDALPDIPGILAIWGEGNAVQALKKVKLPSNVSILYWGDIDREGFAILARLRTAFPDTKSIAMDNNTFETFRNFALPEDSGGSAQPQYLAEEERMVLQKLEKGMPKGSALRLEQERLDIKYVVSRLVADLTCDPGLYTEKITGSQ